MSTIHVDVVSVRGIHLLRRSQIRGACLVRSGELGIYPRHTPLISRIKAGFGAHREARWGEEFIFVAGGILEVQPDRVTVLSDTAIRGKDLDEEKANEARVAAQEAVKNAATELDLAKATSELAIMAAQLSALRKYRRNK
jgi:F-type H+-transporting ATPase subunit epsilon